MVSFTLVSVILPYKSQFSGFTEPLRITHNCAWYLEEKGVMIGVAFVFDPQTQNLGFVPTVCFYHLIGFGYYLGGSFCHHEAHYIQVLEM